ncbi:uncharacterized protein METZ01_LOCUS113449 [marine metagenome]|uniref:Uncharacterized protein n=1 Tax=marine metagenome TaxID=408172 RepID=A0A381X761_9ZZZZ
MVVTWNVLSVRNQTQNSAYHPSAAVFSRMVR